VKPLDQTWPIPAAAQIACLLEASAPKLGNVHPTASYQDMHFGHFVASAIAVGQVFQDVQKLTVGQLVLATAEATQQRAGCNTNLGTLLLLAPLAVAASSILSVDHSIDSKKLSQAVGQTLSKLTPADSRDVYAAIRIAKPSGLGRVQDNDVLAQAPDCLIAAMTQAAKIDAVARQYTNGFADIFERLLPWLSAELQSDSDPLASIVRLQLRWLAHEPDGLIVRKMGTKSAQEVQQRAAAVHDLFRQDSPAAARELGELDQFLRRESNLRNPGTTADLIACTLFCRLLGCGLSSLQNGCGGRKP
jgi:triphosphoribosyl-dephospho-CoA synthase